MTPALVFLSTGGTIEKIYDPVSGRLGFGNSAIEQWLTDARIGIAWRAETLMLVDSLEMTDGERKQIAHHIAKTPESKIVVLHGTDTMIETARLVMLHRKDHQTVVFTGAMVPASLEHSDALFNIGFAASAAQLLPAGVYVAMSGKVFTADRVRKNKDKGLFESIKTQ